MDKVENADARTAPATGAELRQRPRHEVDADASIMILSHEASYPCRVLDLSMTGCRLFTSLHFPGAARARAELSFKLRGIVLRFGGEIQWTDGHHMVGVRFAEMASRRKEELAEVLAEIEALNAARKAAEEAELEAGDQPAMSAPQPAAQALKPSAPMPVPIPAAPTPARQPQPVLQPPSAPPPPTVKLPQAAPAASKRERRSQSRHEVNSSATILLVNVGSKVHGQIVDLSNAGCRIRTGENFPVGIYTRVEVEFHLDGLPFRLGGVVQALHSRQNVGIRFLDMSERKREQLECLMDDMEQARRAQQQTGTSQG